MNPKVKNYLVVGNERYNKTKLPIVEQFQVLDSDNIISNSDFNRSTFNLNSFEKLENGIHEFEESFRHNYYLETPRHVGK